MNIPNYVNSPMVDKEGNLTTEWSNVMTQLLTELQLNLSNEGYKLPQLPTDDIDRLGSNVDTEARTEGSTLYDSTTKEFKVYLDGAWRVVQVV